MTEPKPTTCAVCGSDLLEDDGYMSCPVYIGIIGHKSDEHTSYPVED